MGADTSTGDESSQQFALILRVSQSNGKPLPVGGFTGQAIDTSFSCITMLAVLKVEFYVFNYLKL